MRCFRLRDKPGCWDNWGFLDFSWFVGPGRFLFEKSGFGMCRSRRDIYIAGVISPKSRFSNRICREIFGRLPISKSRSFLSHIWTLSQTWPLSKARSWLGIRISGPDASKSSMLHQKVKKNVPSPDFPGSLTRSQLVLGAVSYTHLTLPTKA